LRKGPKGLLVLKTTVVSSGARTSLITAKRLLNELDPLGSMSRSKWYFTDAALSDVPSWNLTPGWSLNVHSV